MTHSKDTISRQTAPESRSVASTVSKNAISLPAVPSFIQSEEVKEEKKPLQLKAVPVNVTDDQHGGHQNTTVSSPGKPVQRVSKKDKDGTTIEVEELKEGWFPFALEDGMGLGIKANIWKLQGSDPRPWDDEKIFYTEDDEDFLKPVTVAMINKYWGRKVFGLCKNIGPRLDH